MMKRARKEKHIALGFIYGEHGAVCMNPKDKDAERTWDAFDNIVTIGYDDSHDRRLAALKTLNTTATVGRASNKFKAFVGKKTKAHLSMGTMFAAHPRVHSGNVSGAPADAIFEEPKDRAPDDQDNAHVDEAATAPTRGFPAQHKNQEAELTERIAFLEQERDAAKTEIDRLRGELRETLRCFLRKLSSAPATTFSSGVIRKKQKLTARSPASLLDPVVHRGREERRRYIDL